MKLIHKHVLCLLLSSSVVSAVTVEQEFPIVGSKRTSLADREAEPPQKHIKQNTSSEQLIKGIIEDIEKLPFQEGNKREEEIRKLLQVDDFFKIATELSRDADYGDSLTLILKDIALSPQVDISERFKAANLAISNIQSNSFNLFSFSPYDAWDIALSFLYDPIKGEIIDIPLFYTQSTLTELKNNRNLAMLIIPCLSRIPSQRPILEELAKDQRFRSYPIANKILTLLNEVRSFKIPSPEEEDHPVREKIPILKELFENNFYFIASRLLENEEYSQKFEYILKRAIAGSSYFQVEERERLRAASFLLSKYQSASSILKQLDIILCLAYDGSGELREAFNHAQLPQTLSNQLFINSDSVKIIKVYLERLSREGLMKAKLDDLLKIALNKNSLSSWLVPTFLAKKGIKDPNARERLISFLQSPNIKPNHRLSLILNYNREYREEFGSFPHISSPLSDWCFKVAPILVNLILDQSILEYDCMQAVNHLIKMGFTQDAYSILLTIAQTYDYALRCQAICKLDKLGQTLEITLLQKVLSLLKDRKREEDLLINTEEEEEYDWISLIDVLRKYNLLTEEKYFEQLALIAKLPLKSEEICCEVTEEYCKRAIKILHKHGRVDGEILDLLSLCFLFSSI